MNLQRYGRLCAEERKWREHLLETHPDEPQPPESPSVIFAGLLGMLFGSVGTLVVLLAIAVLTR